MTTTDMTRAVITAALAGPYVYRTTMPPQGGPELAAPPPPNQVSQAPGAALSPETVAALHRCWRRGDSTRTTADTCQVSQTTVRRYYARFKASAHPPARG